MRLETASNYDSWQCDTPSEKGEEETATSYEKELDLGFNMALIIRFDFVVKHILKAPGHLCICCHGLRPMLCLKKSFPVHEKSWRHQCSPHHVSRASEIIWGLEEASLRFWRHIIHLSSTASLRGPKMIVLELRNCSAFPCFRPFVQVEISWIFQAVKVSFYPNLSGVRSRIFLYCSQMLWTIKWILEFFIGFIKFLLLSNDMLTLITSRFCQMIHPIFLPPEEQTAYHILTGYIQRNIDQLNYKIIMEN